MRLRQLVVVSLVASCASSPQHRPSAAARRGFPPGCVNRPALQLVKMATPASAAELEWARDFGAAYGLNISWGAPTALPAPVTTAAGEQQVAEELIAALNTRPDRPPPSTVVVGLTERDLFIRGKTDWYWAFGLWEGQTIVISTARMEPKSPLFHGRLSKHLARVLGTVICGLPRTGPPASELRREVGGLADLDEIQESNWALDAPAVPRSSALDHDAVADQLVEVDALIKDRQPHQAIALANQIIAQYEAAYPPSDRMIFCAENMEQTLSYSLLAAKQHKEGTVLDAIWSLAWFFKGFALAELKRYPDAEVSLGHALALAPQNAKVLLELGFVQQSQRRPLEAVKTFERALAAAELADEARQNKLRARAMRGIGFNQIELGDLDGAEKSFLEAIKLDPEDPGAARELRYIDQQRRKAPVQPL